MTRILLFLLATTGAMTQTKVTFDEGSALPPGWQAGITGNGTARWEVTRFDDFAIGTTKP